MLPSPRLFRSRWVALLWAAGICWTAIDVADENSPPAPPANTTDAAANDSGNDAQAAAVLNGLF